MVKPQVEKYPIIVPRYRGYIAALSMYAPIVTPIMVTRAQLQQMLLSGLDVYLFDLNTKMTSQITITDIAGNKNPMDKLKLVAPKTSKTIIGAPKKQEVMPTVKKPEENRFVERFDSPETLRRGPIPVQVVDTPKEETVDPLEEDAKLASIPDTGADIPEEAPAEPVEEENNEEPVVETVTTESTYFRSLMDSDHVDPDSVQWQNLTKKQKKLIRAKIENQK